MGGLDPYGTDIAMGAGGDLVVTPSGGLADQSGALNCAQALVLRLRTTAGELPLHSDYGSVLLTQIGAKALDDGLAVTKATSELQRILEADTRFLAASDITATSDPANPTVLRVGFALELTGGEAVLVDDAADPRLDEISVNDTPTLDSFGDDVDLLDGAEVLADVDDELPELEQFLGDEDAAADSDAEDT